STAGDEAVLGRQIATVDSARVQSRGARPPASPKGSGRPLAERTPAVPRPSAPPAAPPSTRVPIDVDRASRAELVTLPGIGPALADRILAERNANGPFGCLAA